MSEISSIHLAFRNFVLDKYKTRTEAAKQYGVSKQFISNICNGLAAPTQTMLDDMGVKKEVKRKFVFCAKGA